ARDPHVRVAAFSESLAGAIRDEGDPRAVGRPLWIGVVPIFARSDPLRCAGLYVNDEDVAAFVVEPTRVVELVRRMKVMAHVAARWMFIARACATEQDDARAIGRPLHGARAVSVIGQAARLAALHRQQIDLRARRLGGARRAQGT